MTLSITHENDPRGLVQPVFITYNNNVEILLEQQPEIIGPSIDANINAGASLFYKFREWLDVVQLFSQTSDMSLYIYLHIFIVEGAAVSEVSIPRHNHLQSSSYHISDLRPVSMDLSSSVRQSPPNSQKNNIIVRLKNSSVLLICKLYYQILKAHTFLMSDAALHLLFGSVEGWYVMQFNSALL